MLSPEYLESLPEPLLKLWQQVEDDILRDIGRRIRKMDTLTDTAAYQAYRLEQTKLLHTDIVKLISKYSGKSESAIRKMLTDAAVETLRTEDVVHAAAGVKLTPINESQNLLNLLNAGYRQTAGTWRNLTATTANTVTRQFEDALDRAWLQVSSGAFDYQTAIRRAVDGLAEHMDGVTYPSGHHDSLEVAVRRATLTGVNQTCGKLQWERREQAGCEFVEVTAHSGARDTGSGPANHAGWQGKVYHVGGAIDHEGEHYEDFETATGYGTGDGLCGWNCRHNYCSFWPGISSRVYTDEQLAELSAKNIEYNGQMYSRYEINQMQRAKERNVRKWKKTWMIEKEAGLDATTSAIRLKNARKSLSDFAKATGGRVDSARTATWNTSKLPGKRFGHSEATSANWDVRKADLALADSRISSFGSKLSTNSQSEYDLSTTKYAWNDQQGVSQWDQKARKALYEVEYNSRNYKKEVSHVYSSDGTLVSEKHGTSGEVVFTSTEIKSMKDCVLTHNHPNGSCISPQDINILRRGQLTEIRAVTARGVYSLQRPSHWPKDLSSIAKIEKAYYNIDSKVSPAIYAKAAYGDITYAQAELLSQEATILAFVQQYGGGFRFDSWDALMKEK